MRERRAIYHHNGYRLRSYTELLWARVLEAAEIFYLYEPDLVRVDDGYYLPDFWLPNVGVYLEVKGKNPTDIEIQKADAVMAHTGREVMFLVGRPESDREGLMNCGMLVRGLGGWTNGLCPYDLHCLVRDHVGYGMWSRISAAAKGDILEELFLGMADRSDMEQCLRETHAPVNAERMASLPAPSVCERGIKWFLDRQQFRLSQRGAA
ncbi:hypothetical protein CXG50_12180 [Pseudomonas plecoglossicida]|uniref:hypothetical protein n=1 Tax=Pseudomonas plecoglossicida TaxID=70775 RepID=UPI000C7DE85F|nr:hypothetical protein [Pseudomonas plecoglossicida]PLU99899.1 hypothetical protein CXG52_06645 [Pseudomonas plecoglossicida]PLV09159.1 hypothetical protein CXG50_12180 [Pseudomonas plecoglossicida]